VGFNGVLFWGGMILIGFIISAIILFSRKGKQVKWVVGASVLVVFGVLCERYLIVIPGLSHPPDLFPGMEINQAASVYEEGVAAYAPSIYEILQALGVLGFISLLFMGGLKFLKLLPTEARVVRPEPTAASPAAPTAGAPA
jgi:Ni/Fe-hydrogenase subunit HybB-like protein